MPQAIKITAGDRFGRLVATGETQTNSQGRTTYVFKCDCGKELVIRASYVTTGHTQSCGCIRTEMTIARNTKHGLCKDPRFNIWRSMISRCHNPKDKKYYAYGARGITVCDAWRASATQFFLDIGIRPEKHTIDRIDNNKGYEPENCQWAIMKVQARNKRATHKLTYDSRTLCLVDWQNLCGFGRILYKRIKLGWSTEKALTTPQIGRPESGYKPANAM